MRKKVHLVVSGIVQGVFFRASASKVAMSLKLTGFIRNLPNGAVEVFAEGEEEMLKRIIEWCRQGPPGAHVENVSIEWLEANNQFNSFQIR